MRSHGSQSSLRRGKRGSAGLSHALTASAGEAVEALESRQFLSSVFAVTDNNTLLEFDSANPAAIVRSLPITGLGAGEVMSALDFDTVGERLYGIPSGTRTPVYTIDRLTGVATRVGPGVPFGFPTSQATGLAYDELHGYLRYIDETFGNYRLDPATGLQLRNDAGQEGLAEIAYRPLNGDPDNFGFSGVNYITDEFMDLDPERMTVLGGGSLGVDTDRFVGLDYAADGTPYLSLRVAGVQKFGTIGEDGHSFVEIGTIGDGSQYTIRGMAMEPARRAPAIAPGPTPALGAINEDDANNAGSLVSSLTAGLVTDPSPGALSGIAITGLDAAAGVWQYSLNGSTWNAVGAVSDGSALLLAADATTRVRFVPGANFNGSIGQALRFRAWDRIAGDAGTHADIGSPLLQGTVSDQSVWSALSVLPVRDAPTVSSPQPTGGSFTLNDNQTVTPFQAVTIGYIDSASRALTIDLTINDASRGVLTSASLNAAGFTAVNAATGAYRFTGAAASATAAIRQLVFKPAENIAPVGQSSVTLFTITANDGLGVGAQAFSPFIASRSVRNEPVLAVAGGPFHISDKDTLAPFTQTTITTVDFGPPTLTVDVVLGAGVGVLTPESLAASGFALVMGATGTYRFTGNAGAATAAIRQLVFRPSENIAPVGNAANLSFGVYVSDGLGPAVAAQTADITIDSVNDAPVFTRLTNSTMRFNRNVKPFRRVLITDVDPAQPVTVTVTINLPRKGDFITSSINSSGFERLRRGRYQFIGLPSEATAAVHRLKFGWSSRLNWTIDQQIKIRLTVTDASDAWMSNNTTKVTLRH